MSEYTTFVGLDVHKETIQVAMLLPGQREAVEWQCCNEGAAIRKLVQKVRRAAPRKEEVTMRYEAGPCGFALQRQLALAQVPCAVVAPSLIPRKAGERVKTDRRDARKLAELWRAGLLTEVAPPTEAEEAVRDLCRCHEDARKDLMAARHRLLKFLLRHGRSFVGSHWGTAHWKWMRGLHCEEAVEQEVLEYYMMVVLQAEQRVKMIAVRMGEIAQVEPYLEAVGILRGFRGLDTVSALIIVAELFDFARFRTPRELMAYLGLTPSEHSSGPHVRRYGITKTGNGHVRRVLVEAAWNCRHRPLVSQELAKRRRGLPPWAVALADQAMQRLYRRFRRLEARGKPAQKVATAVARELTGFVWAALQRVLAPQTHQA